MTRAHLQIRIFINKPEWILIIPNFPSSIMSLFFCVSLIRIHVFEMRVCLKYILYFTALREKYHQNIFSLRITIERDCEWMYIYIYMLIYTYITFETWFSSDRSNSLYFQGKCTGRCTIENELINRSRSPTIS